ncbi:MAG: trypsin-like peptidase domain-containing protein [Litoreibacter sp.]|nr:trypsin-like peptidase domain-containing protein [Litoreibacter sp.]
MRFLPIVLAAFFVALGAVIPSKSFATPSKEIIRQVDPSVGRILVKTSQGSGSGSGFVVGYDNNSTDFFMVTNDHVIAGIQDGFVGFLKDGEVKAYGFKIVTTSREEDLAILRVRMGDETYRPPAVPLAGYDFEKGDEVFALGFPGISTRLEVDRSSPSRFETTLTNGSISKVFVAPINASNKAVELVQHTALINPGNSGGPLFDFCGNVVGVNTRFVTADRAQRVFVSSSIKVTAGLLTSTNSPFVMQRKTCDPNAPTAAPPPQVADPGSDTMFGLPVWGLALGGLAVLGAVGGIVAFAGKGGTTPPPANNDGPIVDPTPVASVALKVAAKLPDGTQKAFKLSPGQLKAGATIGRTSSADITIDSPKISREHARIKLDGRRLIIEDLGSTNVVEVEGKRLSANAPEQINTRAKINLGNVVLRLAKP